MSMLARLATTGGATTTYVDDVFSTYLYTGNGSTQTITNGIDLAGKGGLVWSKRRSTAESHVWLDSARNNGGAAIYSDSTGAQQSAGNFIQSFNSNGYSIGSNSLFNASGSTNVSWTFRKAPKFFDVVTYTGNGVAGRTVAHNLGSVPGCMIVKRTDQVTNWEVYHRSLGATKFIWLNSTAGEQTSTARWNDTNPTSTQFTVGSSDNVNASGGSYVAYLFAHDTAADGLIQCGSYTGNGSATGPTVTLGWEPQWLLIKNASTGTGNWMIVDATRGFTADGTVNELFPNLSNAENVGAIRVAPSATGFQITTSSYPNTSGTSYIYLAIRRPNKPPTSGTSVFTPVQASAGTQTTGFPIDTQIYAWTTRSTDDNYVIDRLRGVSTSTSSDIGPQLKTNKLDSESNSTNYAKNWTNQSFDVPLNYVTLPTVYWNFRRAPGFFDVVCYTGNGVSNTSYTHNLSAIPELAFIKRRNTTGEWWVCRMNPTTVDTAQLQSTAAFTLGTTYGGSSIMKAAPTSTTFNLGNYADVNAAGGTYVAYLFASLPGISKVGSYTGNGGTVNTNGTSQTINCGFTGGARFVLVKRTDSTGNWYVFDTARGIVAASDPYLLLNSTAAEVTTVDAVDTNNSGFIVNQTSGTNLNVTNATYIYLAIA